LNPTAAIEFLRLLAMLYSAFVFAYMPAAGLSLNSEGCPGKLQGRCIRLVVYIPMSLGIFEVLCTSLHNVQTI
jgi:hypothetical protein